MGANRDAKARPVRAHTEGCVFSLSRSRVGSEGHQVGRHWFPDWRADEGIPGHNHIHALTNYHVAVFSEDAPPNPVVRINLLSGGAEAFDFDPSEWIFKPKFSDIAISPPLNLDPQKHDFMMFAEKWFMTPKDEVTDEIGPGEDVFMIGRFVDYDGVETNVPAARFGHISMMTANIEQSNGYKGRSIILDMHSRSGFSGSPVIVYRTIGSHFFEAQPGKVLTGGGHYIKLLGIHYAQFPEAWELKEKKTQSPITQAALRADSHYIDGLSGMTCVVPAADILTLLFDRELVAMRDKREKMIEETIQRVSGGPRNEAAGKVVPPAIDENPNHREDFMRIAGAAVRKPPQED